MGTLEVEADVTSVIAEGVLGEAAPLSQGFLAYIPCWDSHGISFHSYIRHVLLTICAKDSWDMDRIQSR